MRIASPRRRRLALAALSATALPVLYLHAQEKFPARPLNLVIPFGAGAATDNVARIVGEALAREIGQPVVPLNRPGANGMIAIRSVLALPGDGYNLLFLTNAPIIEQVLKKTNFDIQRDLAPVARAMQGPFGLFASNQLPANSVKELVEYVRKNPGKVNFASSGVGSATHLATERFRIAAGLDMVHVPYPAGTAAVMPALIVGDVGVFVNEMSTMKPFVTDGKVKALATLAEQRSPLYPDTPAMPEAGVPELRDFSAPLLFGVFVERSTPADRVELLNLAINKALATPAVRDRLVGLGYRPANIGGLSPAEFRKVVGEELVRTENAVRDAKITAE